jgi:hypothetical protein
MDNALPPAKTERERSAPYGRVGGGKGVERGWNSSAGRQLEQICNGDKVEALALYQKMKLQGSTIWDAEFEEALKPSDASLKP